MDKFYKALAVALKDLQLFLTDRAAVIAMLLVPLVVGFFSATMYGGGEGGVRLPVVVVIQDSGPYGKSIVEVLSGIGEVNLTELDSPAAPSSKSPVVTGWQRSSFRSILRATSTPTSRSRSP